MDKLTFTNTPQRCPSLSSYKDYRIARPQDPITGSTGNIIPPPPVTSRMEYADTGDMQYSDTNFMEYTIDRVV